MVKKIPPLVADGGELTIMRTLASATWGSWSETYPEGLEPEGKPEGGRTDGYVSALPAAVERRVGGLCRRFVRADLSMSAEDSTSDVEEKLDLAAERTTGQAFFDRDISPAGLGRLVPNVDFVLGDIVPVKVRGRVIPALVTKIEPVVGDGESFGWRVHVGGQMISDEDAALASDAEIRREIVQERRERLKSVGEAKSAAAAADSRASAAQVSADGAVVTAGEAKSTADEALAAVSDSSGVIAGFVDQARAAVVESREFSERAGEFVALSSDYVELASNHAEQASRSAEDAKAAVGESREFSKQAEEALETAGMVAESAAISASQASAKAAEAENALIQAQGYAGTAEQWKNATEQMRGETIQAMQAAQAANTAADKARDEVLAAHGEIITLHGEALQAHSGAISEAQKAIAANTAAGEARDKAIAANADAQKALTGAVDSQGKALTAAQKAIEANVSATEEAGKAAQAATDTAVNAQIVAERVEQAQLDYQSVQDQINAAQDEQLKQISELQEKIVAQSGQLNQVMATNFGVSNPNYSVIPNTGSDKAEYPYRVVIPDMRGSTLHIEFLKYDPHGGTTAQRIMERVMLNAGSSEFVPMKTNELIKITWADTPVKVVRINLDTGKFIPVQNVWTEAPGLKATAKKAAMDANMKASVTWDAATYQEFFRLRLVKDSGVIQELSKTQLGPFFPGGDGSRTMSFVASGFSLAAGESVWVEVQTTIYAEHARTVRSASLSGSWIEEA